MTGDFNNKENNVIETTAVKKGPKEDTYFGKNRDVNKLKVYGTGAESQHTNYVAVKNNNNRNSINNNKKIYNGRSHSCEPKQTRNYNSAGYNETKANHTPRIYNNNFDNRNNNKLYSNNYNNSVHNSAAIHSNGKPITTYNCNENRNNNNNNEDVNLSEFVFKLTPNDHEITRRDKEYLNMMHKIASSYVNPELDQKLEDTYIAIDNMLTEQQSHYFSFCNQMKQIQINNWLLTRSAEEQKQYLERTNSKLPIS